ncbi:MAG: hypothetical protein DWQ01_07805 [Planctomycetota bacterium]|nr:MAG: hypothetical protein DWQ01_07805 [Planctomycetota bacterium]
MRCLALTLWLMAGWVTILPAQTLLQEDFEAGLVPPANWSEISMPGSLVSWGLATVSTTGFGNGTYAGFHDDGVAGFFNENYLITPALDASGVTDLWLHYTQYTRFAADRLLHAIAVSTSDPTNPANFVEVYRDESPGDRLSQVHVNLCAYAGEPVLYLAFHYQGDFDSEWYIDDVIVDDQPPPRQRPFPQLPGQFQPLDPISGWSTDFEVFFGTLPAFMKANELDAETGLADPEAWCNIGQRALPQNPFSGNFALEMALAPGSTNYHDVLNGLVIGLDATGLLPPLTLDFMAYNAGEETDTWDGVFVSTDGILWDRVYGPWSSLPRDQWTAVNGVDLSASSVDLQGRFFLLFAEEDNYPYNQLDGLGVDDIVVHTSGGTTTDIHLRVDQLIHGLTARITVNNTQNGDLVFIGYSFTGQGPSSWDFGVCAPVQLALDAGSPYMGPFPVSGQRMIRPLDVPANLCGITVYAQAVAVRPGDCRVSNALTAVIQ